VVIRILLRPLGRMAETAAAVASGDLSGRMPVARARDVGNLGRTLNRVLGQAELALTAASSSEAAAGESTERMRQAVADAGDRLRRPLSILAGLAGVYRERSRLGADDPDRTISQMADEAARMDAVLENLQPGSTTPLPNRGPAANWRPGSGRRKPLDGPGRMGPG
jgi:two-component system OmpR family sensor kinase